MQKPKELVELLYRKVKEKTIVMPTGFKILDDALQGGFEKRKIIIIGGPPASGKSYFASQIMEGVARNQFTTAYFSLEVSNSLIATRLIAGEARVSPLKLRRNTITDDEWARVDRATGRFMTYNDFMDFYDNQHDLKNILNILKNKKYDFVVIDFLQNIISQGLTEYEQISKAILQIQRISTETDTTILVVSQLSNEAQEKKSEVVKFKGAGTINQVADFSFQVERKQGENSFILHLRKIRDDAPFEPLKFVVDQISGKIIEYI